MTLVLIGTGLLLEGSTPKTKDKQLPGIYIYICYMLIIKEKYGKYITDWSVTHPVWGGLSR